MTEWCAAVLRHMRENRALIRTSFGEIEDRPEAAVSMCEGPNCAGMILTDYVLRLQSTGVAAARRRHPDRGRHAHELDVRRRDLTRRHADRVSAACNQKRRHDTSGSFLRALGVDPAQTPRAGHCAPLPETEPMSIDAFFRQSP